MIPSLMLPYWTERFKQLCKYGFYLSGKNFYFHIGPDWMYGPRAKCIRLSWNNREFLRSDRPVPEGEHLFADEIKLYWSEDRYEPTWYNKRWRLTVRNMKWDEV